MLLKQSGLLLRQQQMATLTYLNPTLSAFMSRGFATPTKKIGLNDQLQDAKKEARKYGIKRRFYDHLPTIARQLPQGLYVLLL